MHLFLVLRVGAEGLNGLLSVLVPLAAFGFCCAPVPLSPPLSEEGGVAWEGQEFCLFLFFGLGLGSVLCACISWLSVFLSNIIPLTWIGFSKYWCRILGSDFFWLLPKVRGDFSPYSFPSCIRPSPGPGVDRV